MSEWKVYVCNPPASGKNGRNFMLSAQEDGVEWKRRSARTPIRAEAEHAAREWLAEIKRTIAPLDRDPTVASILERHLLMTEEADGLEDSTRVTYRTALRRLVPVMGNVRGSQLDRPTVLQAVHALRTGQTPSGKPLKGTTLRLTLRRARDAWSWAQERGYVSRPWPRLKPRDVRFGRTKKRPYTDAEVVAVLDWLRDHAPTWHPFYALMAATGMRSSEVCGLRGRDVLRAELEVRFLDAKSKEPTGAPVPVDVMALLPRVAPDAPVFCGPRGGEATPHAANEVKLKAVRALGLPDADLLDVHSFKRSWVDGLYRSGADMGTAMRAARHVSQPVNVGYQRNALGHDVRAAQERVLDMRRKAAGPPTRPLTQEALNPNAGTVLSGSPSNRSGSPLASTAHDDTALTPRPGVARNRSGSGCVVTALGEGWQEDPLGAEAAAALARDPLGVGALLASPRRAATALAWLRANRPDVLARVDEVEATVAAAAPRKEVRRG
jgi:integrase